MKRSLRIAAILIALLVVMCLFVSCGERETKKEVFQIFREYDNVGFDVNAYINTAKETALYVSDDFPMTEYDIDAGQINISERKVSF